MLRGIRLVPSVTKASLKRGKELIRVRISRLRLIGWLSIESNSPLSTVIIDFVPVWSWRKSCSFDLVRTLISKNVDEKAFVHANPRKTLEQIPWESANERLYNRFCQQHKFSAQLASWLCTSAKIARRLKWIPVQDYSAIMFTILCSDSLVRAWLQQSESAVVEFCLIQPRFSLVKNHGSDFNSL